MRSASMTPDPDVEQRITADVSGYVAAIEELMQVNGGGESCPAP